METMNNNVGFYVRYKVFYCESASLSTIRQGQNNLIYAKILVLLTQQSQGYISHIRRQLDPGLIPPYRSGCGFH
jgi:hypothetical protein